MRALGILICFLCTSSLLVAESAVGMLSVPFSGVRVEDFQIQLTCKPSGGRYLVSLHGSQPRPLIYGEVFVLPSSFREAKFTERHSSLNVVLANGSRRIYKVTQRFDSRSFGGGVQEKTAYFQVGANFLIDVADAAGSPVKSTVPQAQQPEKPSFGWFGLLGFFAVIALPLFFVQKYRRGR